MPCRRLACLIVCCLPATVWAVEPRADSRLTVREGLELWLDASRAMEKLSFTGDGQITHWRDASGKGRHLRQENAAAHPKWLKVGEGAVVQFDGVDDHFRATQLGAELKSFTIFIAAAPRQHPGVFRAFLATNAPNERDYQSGLTIDLGPSFTPAFSELNVEGRGFGGAANVRTGATPFGRLCVLEVVSDFDAKSITLAVDGKPEGQRPRDPLPVSFDEITVGARYYNNGAGPQKVDSFGKCDIAEVLVYNRVLTADETKSVREYLKNRYEPLKNALPPDGDGTSLPLVSVENPPPVQMFVPGFTVRELPVDLTNLNNVKYRPDGTLVGLGYDGKVWLLRDTDNDGVEDQATQFWDNRSGLRSAIGMDLTPPGYQHGDGLFVVGKTRCVLIVDTDKNGVADKEIDVAGGWKESFHQVDGLGVAYDPRDGSIYYGRGTYNFTDPLLKDKEGKPHYSLTDESTAILRVSPDFKTREIVATGIRFPVGIRINRHGDLFCTDQEGATWVPNGNPFDELLHVQKGRHYGFPARHPMHLPNVLDEPSTFDYGPQHQSTCGLNFNEPVQPNGPTFGPRLWKDDAIVTGYSRGKLYRTKLVKSQAGYVAQTQLFACLKMLTIDACVSPTGSLVVACHSGGPDWGSGPSGKGKLFKIDYVDHDHPQPAFVWAANPREVRVEFDRPVDPRLLTDGLKHTKLTAGTAVRAGDRFESLWPGYAIVQMQKLAPRFDVPVRSMQLTPDGRTLVLATDPIRDAVHYALELRMAWSTRPASGRVEEPTLAASATSEVDLDFDLTGCEATWMPADGSAPWTGWLPHLDLQVARDLTASSAPHALLWAAMEKPGELRLRAKLDLRNMLRSAVQPGSQVDFELPPETVTLTFETGPNSTLTGGDAPQQRKIAWVNDKPFLDVELQMKHGRETPVLTVSWTTNEDDRPRPLPIRRIVLPWADTSGQKSEPALALQPKELEGGSWARGRKEFFGEQAACFKCHTLHGQGGTIGPDLSNLVHRDYASVLRDVTTPSFALNPDHLSYNVLLKDGRTLAGVVRSTATTLQVGDIKGVVTEVSKEDIEELKASSISTMPEGIPKLVGPERFRDLMTFLLTPGPQMPRDKTGPRPKPRTIAEVNAALAGAPNPPEPTKPLRIVLVAGPKDHGPGEHDYPAWQKAWQELLSIADKTEVVSAWEWPEKAEFQKADVMVFYQHGDWNDVRAADIDAYLDRGGGLVYIHWAVDGRRYGREFADRIGLAALGGVGFRHGDLTLKFNKETNHPVTRNIESLKLTDETYWKMVGPLPKERILGTAVEDGQPQPQLWSMEPRKGRVFVSIPGHYSWTFDDPLFRILLLRGMAWTAREPVDRFNDLVWPGADIAR